MASSKKVAAEDLPKEIWALIFDFLPDKDLSTTRAVCSQWRTEADNELLWQGRLQRKFGAIELDNQFRTWREFYIHLLTHQWNWRKGQLFEIDEKNPLRIKCLTSTSTYAPARIEEAIPDNGIHYYEISIHTPITSLGVGVCDPYVDEMAYFLSENSGIGFYAFGKVWNNGEDDGSYPSFTTEDKVGILIHRGLKRLQFFINGVPAKDLIDISWVTKQLHVVSLMEIGNVIEFHGYTTPATFPEPIRDFITSKWDTKKE